MVNRKTMINCEICNKKFSQITSTHLKKHGISVKEYKIMFPNFPIFSEEICQKLSKNCKKMQSNGNFGFKKGHKINKNREPYNKGETKETNESVCKYSLKLKNRKISQETKLRMSESYKNGILNGTRKLLKGSLNGMYGKKLSESHIKALHAGYRNKKTKPERSIEKMCTQYGFIYTGDRSFSVKFKNGKIKYPDFIIPNCRIAIEVHGDYWHKGENGNDLVKKYKEIGWDSLVIGENEINSGKISPETIENFLGIFDIENFSFDNFSGEWIN